MPWFIKHERFTKETLNLPLKERRIFLKKHKSWVEKLDNTGQKISSGYLVDEKGKPGGGGFLIIQANSFSEALTCVKQDPMIINGLVTWHLEEWIPISGSLIT
tara:strand:- start:216 stop:524 length:309 start_codon:yes stop_codon:yes gene_type:complete